MIISNHLLFVLFFLKRCLCIFLVDDSLMINLRLDNYSHSARCKIPWMLLQASPVIIFWWAAVALDEWCKFNTMTISRHLFDITLYCFSVVAHLETILCWVWCCFGYNGWKFCAMIIDYFQLNLHPLLTSVSGMILYCFDFLYTRYNQNRLKILAFLLIFENNHMFVLKPFFCSTWQTNKLIML